MRVRVCRAADRFVTRTDWLTSWHCFSYQQHYDPANTHFGLLLACNDDTLAPGAGFDRHEHREIEAVTWVLSGALRHEDSAGNAAVVRPGTVQRMTAGRGVWHAERNASRTEPLRHVQMWLAPGAAGLDPSYQQADVTGSLAGGGLVPVASGAAQVAAPVRLHQPHATLYAARLPPHQPVTLPPAPYLHVYVTAGSATQRLPADSPAAGPHPTRAAPSDAVPNTEAVPCTEALGTGDSLRITDAVAHRVVAGPDGAELLVWAMSRTL